MTTKTDTEDVSIPPAIVSKSLCAQAIAASITNLPVVCLSFLTIDIEHRLGIITITVHSQCEVCPCTWDEVNLPTLLVLWRTTTVLSTECQLVNTSAWIVCRPECTPVVLWPTCTWITHIDNLSTTRQAVELNPECKRPSMFIISQTELRHLNAYWLLESLDTS